MNIFRKVNQISYKQAIGMSVFLTVLLAVPVGVYLTQQETKLDSQAAYEKPKIATQAKSTPGPIPDLPPVIGRVFPWVGKIGDVVWLQGENFGVNPADKELKIGGVVVTEDEISAWEDNLIETIIPVGVKQGGVIELRIGNHPIVRSLPYVLYEENTEIKLGKRDNKIIVDNGSVNVSKAIIWTGDDEIEEEKHNMEVNFQGDSKTVIFETQLPIKTILIFDNQGKLLPYYVNVREFDF